MSDPILSAVLSLSSLGLLSATILYIVSQRFKVEENPKIDEIEGLLPSANCGGCGFPGCRQFAEQIVRTNSLENMYCPVGPPATMESIAQAMNLSVQLKVPQVAVIKCQPMNDPANRKVTFQGETCLLAHTQFAGEGLCPHACLALGDCVKVCDFDAMAVNQQTGKIDIDPIKCTACGACLKVCPRDLIELRNKDAQQVFVACMNQEKGAVAKKNCANACIACLKCGKVIPDNAQIQIKNNLSYIPNDVDFATYRQELINCCPTNAITPIRFMPAPAKSNKKEEV